MTPEPSPASATLPAIITAEPADAEALSHVIADAFHPIAPSAWLIPDDAARRAIFPGYFRLFVEHALASGIVHTTVDRDAAALWIPVGHGGSAPPAGYAERLTALTGPWAHRFRAFDAALGERHPVGIPHHHLAMLAVHPDKQGQGIGTALLHAHHHSLDHDRIAAYLEASDQLTRQLYLRHGYVLRPNAPIRLPDGEPEMWPMWREPMWREPQR